MYDLPEWESFTPGSPEVQAWFEKHPMSVYANSSELNWEKVSENINSSRYPFEGIGLWAFFFMLIATGQLTIEMILAGPRIRKRGQIPKLKKAAKVKVSAEENDLVHKERQKVHHKYVKLLTKLDLWVALPTRKIQFKKPLQAKKTPSPHASTKYIDEQADSSDDGIDAFVIEQDKRYMKVSKHGRGKLTSTPKSSDSVFEASDREGAGEGVEGLPGIGRLQGMGARVLKEKVNNDVQVIVAPKKTKNLHVSNITQPTSKRVKHNKEGDEAHPTEEEEEVVLIEVGQQEDDDNGSDEEEEEEEGEQKGAQEQEEPQYMERARQKGRSEGEELEDGQEVELTPKQQAAKKAELAGLDAQIAALLSRKRKASALTSSGEDLIHSLFTV